MCSVNSTIHDSIAIESEFFDFDPNQQLLTWNFFNPAILCINYPFCYLWDIDLLALGILKHQKAKCAIEHRFTEYTSASSQLPFQHTYVRVFTINR